MLLFAVIGACETDEALTEANRRIWGANLHRKIDDNEADYLARYVAARRAPSGQASGIGVMVGRIKGHAYSRSVSRQRPRSPDRKASRDRRRTWARSGVMPSQLRAFYTEGEAAALAVIAQGVKAKGDCRDPIDKIAALAGVCRTTVQNAMHEARRLGHLRITERPQRGRKSLTNIVEILSAVWRVWLRLSGIGSKTPKMVSPTGREESLYRSAEQVAAPKGAWKRNRRQDLGSDPNVEPGDRP